MKIKKINQLDAQIHANFGARTNSNNIEAISCAEYASDAHNSFTSISSLTFWFECTALIFHQRKNRTVGDIQTVSQR